jgi:predicted aspartyl protease
MRHSPGLRGLAALTACIAPLLTAQGACNLSQLAEWKIERVNNRPMVDGQINGQPLRVLIDTGAQRSFISIGAARRLDLPVRDAGRSTLGVGGSNRLQSAVIKHLQLGAYGVDDLRLDVTGGGLGAGPTDVGFVLGADFFLHFTTEFDLAHDRIRLLQPQECHVDQLVYWADGYFKVDVEPMSSADPHIETHILVNGSRARAWLDTGAAVSFITTVAAHSAGVGTRDADVKPSTPVRGLAGASIPTWIGRFDAVGIGNETVRNARLRIGDLWGADREQHLGSRIGQVPDVLPDLILGDDFFQAHRIIVSPQQHVALFTYAGGPVFQILRPDEHADSQPDR